jgi:predicted Rossmann fold nucleotide-binding protein DprA/Smf involved in DNA uptake
LYRKRISLTLARYHYNVRVHWLTWHQIIGFLKSWQGAAAASFALLATIYYGPKKMLETWDWYIDRIGHDDPVSEIVRKPKHKPIYVQNNVAAYDSQVEIPYKPEEIANQIGRKQSSVIRSLKRLEKRGKVKEVHGGWERV